MKKQLSLLFVLLGFLTIAEAQSQTGRVRWEQIKTGTQGQIAIVGTDGNGHWVTPLYTSWSDTLTYVATKSDVKNLNDKEVINGSFNTTTGDNTLTKRGGGSVTWNGDGRYVPLSQKAASNGVATLGVDGKVPTSQLPALTGRTTYVVSSQAAMLALSANQGDIAVRTDSSIAYILQGAPASTYGNWVLLPSQQAPVVSVNGQTGAVTITTDNVSEGATNKYYSNSLARNALSATGPIGYNTGSGGITHNTSGVTAGSYNTVTVDVFGHVTAGSNATYLVPTDLNNYYTKTQLQTGGQAAVAWPNITGKPTNLGAQETKDQFTSGTSTVITLTQTPLYPTAVQVFLNGVLLQTSDYAINATTLTLGFTREATDVVTIKYSY